jgi:hypothetical protein
VVGGGLSILAGVGLLLIGIRQLRPQPAEMEEFVSGQSERVRPAFMEAAGPVLGLVATVLGVILVSAGLLYVLLGIL